MQVHLHLIKQILNRMWKMQIVVQIFLIQSNSNTFSTFILLDF